MYDMIQHIFGSLEVSERAVKSLEKSLRRQRLISFGVVIACIGGFIAREAQIRDLQQRVERIEAMPEFYEVAPGDWARLRRETETR